MESIDITDMNGQPILEGSRVRVHQEEEISLATVMDVSLNSPTVRDNGWWVDIEKDDKQGLEGMMSYILEVIYDEGL